MNNQEPTVAQRESLSFGEVLQRERQLRGLTLREAAHATKVSTRYLEALEHNDFDTLPGGVYNKGFLRVYAQFIGLDPEEMVNYYLYEISQRQHETELVPSRRREERHLPWLRGLLMALGALVVLAVMVWVLG